MNLLILTFIAVFLLIATAGILVFNRAALDRRLAEVVAREPQTGLLRRLTGLAERRSELGFLISPLNRVLPKTAEEVSVVQKRLIRAGLRRDAHLNLFYAFKVLVPVTLIIVATTTGLYQYGAFFVYGIAAGLGFLIPDFWLGNRISNRQTEIRLAVPDALDMMVICIEAGLSLDQATIRTADEIEVTHPALADELQLVNLEQRAGRVRSEAWQHFAERADIEVVRSLVAMLIQTDQFGTSISKALRTQADTLRTQRRQRAEEQAAKTTVKLVFPLVLFIFPSLFVVTLGPAIIMILESFEKYFK